MAALWDMHHPYRFAGEAPEETVQNLGAFIKYTHVKDSVMVDGKAAVPHDGRGRPAHGRHDAGALRSINYEGYISLEWLKRYAPDLSRRGHRVPPVCQLYGPVSGQSAAGIRRLYDNHAQYRQVCLAQGDAHRPDLPPGAGPHGGGVPRPVLPSATPPWTIPAPIRSSGTMWTPLPGPSSPWG